MSNKEIDQKSQLDFWCWSRRPN